mmetsp:Transcript_17689/g.35660  ORF Transcript_17689/g.35660 Transcript_17689/m.35660 type:complete len:125 (+) Transcript_17689:652-1026(+)
MTLTEANSPLSSLIWVDVEGAQGPSHTAAFSSRHWGRSHTASGIATDFATVTASGSYAGASKSGGSSGVIASQAFAIAALTTEGIAAGVGYRMRRDRKPQRAAAVRRSATATSKSVGAGPLSVH